jgi:hypothetical protein
MELAMFVIKPISDESQNIAAVTVTAILSNLVNIPITINRHAKKFKILPKEKMYEIKLRKIIPNGFSKIKPYIGFKKTGQIARYKNESAAIIADTLIFFFVSDIMYSPLIFFI